MLDKRRFFFSICCCFGFNIRPSENSVCSRFPTHQSFRVELQLAAISEPGDRERKESCGRLGSKVWEPLRRGRLDEQETWDVGTFRSIEFRSIRFDDKPILSRWRVDPKTAFA